jgi:NTE family protein
MDAGRTALVLTGGGARAAYQVGVLNAIRIIRGRRSGNPFPVLCGTSAGAINATTLATYAEDFNRGVRKLVGIWANFNVAQIYRADAAALLGSGLSWSSALLTGWLVHQAPRSLLDNAPLRALLGDVLDLSAIPRAIDAGALRALCVSASGYTSGESLSFFQAAPDVAPWRRTQRIGVPTVMTLDHLMASSALPFLFPAVRIHREYFGDGSMRQQAPISPAIHLGAERILVIGAGRGIDEKRVRTESYPSPAQIAGHALSSIFLDSLAMDLERLQRINATLDVVAARGALPEELALRRIETLVISPSQRFDPIAARHAASLPRALHLFLRGIGATRRNGAALLSYLLFEKGYTRALMELGLRDAMARRDEIARFLRVDTECRTH